ncbi:MAG TPA: hypothetical protein VFS21_17635 [Roseiflexaceae bacterium]|nr:hypothetical protein [Roseiflexaceae bacterium]
MYLGWYDDDPKKAVALKIEEAIEAYVSRFRRRPNVVLVNEADKADVSGVAVRSESFIRRNNFWVGREALVAQTAVREPAPAGAIAAKA